MSLSLSRMILPVLSRVGSRCYDQHSKGRFFCLLPLENSFGEMCFGASVVIRCCLYHEGMLQQVRCSSPLRGLTLQTPLSEVGTALGEGRRQGRRLAGHADLIHDNHGVVDLPPRQLGCAHLDDDAAKAPNVGHPSISDILHYDLGCHPPDGALQRNHIARRAAEVCQFGAELSAICALPHQDIRALDVSMQDWRASRVQVVLGF